jgi:hypothetical protein
MLTVEILQEIRYGKPTIHDHDDSLPLLVAQLFQQ